MSHYITVIPAYGRDYATGTAARADWHAGKDFLISTYGPEDGRIINKEDADRAGLTVTIRFARSTKTTAAGAKPPAPKAAKRKPAPRDTRAAARSQYELRPGTKYPRPQQEMGEYCPSRDAGRHLYGRDGYCICGAKYKQKGRPKFGDVNWFTGDELFDRTMGAQRVSMQAQAKRFLDLKKLEEIRGHEFAFDRSGQVVMANPPGKNLARAKHSYVLVDVRDDDVDPLLPTILFQASVHWMIQTPSGKPFVISSDGAYDVHEAKTKAEAIQAAKHNALVNAESGGNESGLGFEYGFWVFNGRLLGGWKATGAPIVWDRVSGRGTEYLAPFRENATYVEMTPAELKKVARMGRS